MSPTFLNGTILLSLNIFLRTVVTQHTNFKVYVCTKEGMEHTLQTTNDEYNSLVFTSLF